MQISVTLNNTNQNPPVYFYFLVYVHLYFVSCSFLTCPGGTLLRFTVYYIYCRNDNKPSLT